jgi:SAM-dependent methyltransferase
MEIDKNIISYYNLGREKYRLEQEGFIDIEKIRTLDILQRYLPPAPKIIYDIGGAAGVYSFILSDQGYEVHLFDPMPLHIEQALEENSKVKNKLNSIEIGEARTLNRPNESTDIILFFGPLYHLIDKDNRLKALKKAYSLLKPGGLIFSAGISKYASLFDGFHRKFVLDKEFLDILDRDLQTGIHLNKSGKKEYFTSSYFHHPDELKEEHEESGFTSIETITIEGPISLLHNYNEYFNSEDTTKLFLNFARKIEKEPSLSGASGHIMVIGKKL